MMQGSVSVSRLVDSECSARHVSPCCWIFGDFVSVESMAIPNYGCWNLNCLNYIASWYSSKRPSWQQPPRPEEEPTLEPRPWPSPRSFRRRPLTASLAPVSFPLHKVCLPSLRSSSPPYRTHTTDFPLLHTHTQPSNERC